MEKIKITPQQKEQFNSMLTVLKKIANQYNSLEYINNFSQKDYGLPPAELLAMNYDNIQSDAALCIHNITPLT